MGPSISSMPCEWFRFARDGYMPAEEVLGRARCSVVGRYATSLDTRGAGVAMAGLWIRPDDDVNELDAAAI